MKNIDLNAFLKDTADAIRTKEGSSGLINPQEFSTRIINLDSGGSGEELEGEYFLAKPNGRYWKFSFIDDVTNYYIDYKRFSKEEINALGFFCSIIMPSAMIYGAAVCNTGVPFDSELRADIFQVKVRAGSMQQQIQWIIDGTEDLVDLEIFNEGFCRVWLEGQVKTSPTTDTMPFHEYDLVSYVKQLGSMEGMEMTDEDVMALLQEAFMLIPATEEEYKAARREN